MISIDKSVWKLIKLAPTGSTFKVFTFIVINQPDDGLFGFQTTKEQLAIELKLSQTSIFRDLRWLKSEMLIQEVKQFDTIDLMVNPRFVMNNSDFKARQEEWNRRCKLDIQRELRLKKQKHRRELKNAQNQS